VRLNALSARIAMADGPATIAANKGRYDMASDRVAIDGPVIFQAQDGYRIQTRDVAVDLTSRKMASGGPVDGRMPLGTFSANRMSPCAGVFHRMSYFDGAISLICK